MHNSKIFTVLLLKDKNHLQQSMKHKRTWICNYSQFKYVKQEQATSV
jgi:hypothetical protein